MDTWRMSRGRFAATSAWTAAEVRASIDQLLDHVADRLPADRATRVVIKPNLNNDLPALTGNSVDLRVLAGLFGSLRDRGYTNLILADGSNVGVERRQINSFRRLRVDRLAERYGVALVDLNHDDGEAIPLAAGAAPRVARTVLDAPFLLSVPKIKTHIEAGLSCALKNWVGICRGQDKRQMHYDLGRNIYLLGQRVRPHLILVDGLVGMEGNGPGDGEPFRLGELYVSDDAFLCDAVVARRMGLAWTSVPYLRHAIDGGELSPALQDEILRSVPVIRPIKPAPARSLLTRISEDRRLFALKKLARPITDRPEVAEAAYRLGVIQDVYGRDDDAVDGLARAAEACGPCRRCESFCPVGLPLEQIGLTPAHDACVSCLYCWWVCPNEALTLTGPLNHLARQGALYKTALERL